jgi:hypothetical protein
VTAYVASSICAPPRAESVHATPFLAAVLFTLGSHAARETPQSDFAPACDVAFLDADTIVVPDWDGKAHTSVDRGATWETHALGRWTRDVAVGPKGVVWSLYWWRRIHGEASGVSLASSRNAGRNWTIVDWPEAWAEHVRAIDFVSQPGEEPVLLDDAGRFWRHECWGPESLASWTRIGTIAPEGRPSCGLALDGALYVATDSDVWRSTSGARAWCSLTGPGHVIGLAPMPPLDPDACCGPRGPRRIAAATSAGDVYTLDLDTDLWTRLGTIPIEGVRAYGIATTTEGVWVCGQGRFDAFGGRMDFAGRWRAPEGLPPRAGPAVAVRRAPDGRVWIADGALYAAGPAA